MIFVLDQAIGLLERTPAVLRSLLVGLSPGWDLGNEGPGSFSPFDVVGHLIDGEEHDWIPRARQMLAGGDTRFVPFDRFRHRERNRGRSIDDLADEFSRLRTANLTALRGFGLTPGQLDLTGVHPEFGAVTLRQHLATWVVHDLGHLAQIARVMARQYAEDVGPWRAYLPVLAAHR